jgi:hypothetical protein
MMYLTSSALNPNIKLLYISAKDASTADKKQRGPRDAIAYGIRSILTSQYGKEFIMEHSFNGQRNRPSIGERRKAEILSITSKLN